MFMVLSPCCSSMFKTMFKTSHFSVSYNLYSHNKNGSSSKNAKRTKKQNLTKVSGLNDEKLIKSKPT